MSVKPIPEGYHTVTPYLIVEGAGQLLDFLELAFDAKVTDKIPGQEGKISHAEVRIGNSMVMMSDAGGDYPPMPAMLHIYVDDVDATYRRAIAAGATSLREPADQFYGDRTGGVKDAVGNQWWIATHVEDVTTEEIARRAAEYQAKSAEAAAT